MGTAAEGAFTKTSSGFAASRHRERGLEVGMGDPLLDRPQVRRFSSTGQTSATHWAAGAAAAGATR